MPETVAVPSFAAVYAEHRQGLFTLALSITRQEAPAEDAVQDAFARLLACDIGPIGDPVAYAYGAVRRAAIDQGRRRRPVLEPGDSIYAGAAPDADLLAADEDRRLRQAVEALPDDERCCLVLRIYGGLSWQQIASALDEPLSTLASRYQRTLARLRQVLEVDHG